MADYEKWKELPSRKKAIWPAAGKGYLNPQHKVMISLDAELTEWLIENLVGQSSFASDLEEAIITTLRVIRGDLDIDEIRQLQRLASRKGAEDGKGTRS